MGEVGKVAIEVELGTKSFEKQIQKTEADLERLAKQQEFLTQLNNRYANSKEKSYRLTAEELNLLHKLGLTMEDVGNKEAFKKIALDIEKANNRLIDLNRNQQKLNPKVEDTNEEIEQTNNSLENTKNKTDSIIKKVLKWGLAVFSIRSAYMMVRQAVSTLSSYDKQIGTDIEYIRFVLANALKPIIETIINLVYKLLAYIGYIAKAWFGVNLFANASAKNFQKVNKGVKDTNKSAKQLQKTLAGFDEMNILQDNGTTSGGGGGGGGISLPTQDLSDLSDIEVPAWLQWIADNGEYILTILVAIGGALLAMKLTTFLGGILGVTEGLGALSAGVGVLTGGLLLLAGSVINMILNWDNMTQSEKEASIEMAALGVALVGLGLAIMGVISGPIAAFIAIMAVVGATIGIVALRKEEEVKATMSVAEADERLTKAKKELNSATNAYKNAVENAKNASKELEKAEKKNKISGKDLFDQVVIGTLTYDKMNKKQKEVYEAYINNIEAQENLTEATGKMNEKITETTRAEQQKSASVYAAEQTYEGYFKKLLDGYNKSKVSAYDMVSKTLELMGDMDEETRKVFAQNLPDNVKKAFTQVREQAVGAEDMLWQFKDGTKMSLKEIEKTGTQMSNQITDGLNGISKKFSKELPNSIQKSIDKVKSLTSQLGNLAKTGAVSITTAVKSAGSKNAKGAIYYPPKLAVGGIINQPGRGVPLAMGGERGAEGVIPLTDAQQMQKLGEAIGRYITINATMINQMNGRVISRELKAIQNDENFGFNGG